MVEKLHPVESTLPESPLLSDCCYDSSVKSLGIEQCLTAASKPFPLLMVGQQVSEATF